MSVKRKRGPTNFNDPRLDYSGYKCADIIDEKKVEDIEEIKLYCRSAKREGVTVTLDIVNLPPIIGDLDHIEYLKINGTMFAKKGDNYYEIIL